MSLDLTNLQPDDVLITDKGEYTFQYYDRSDTQTQLPIYAGAWFTIDGRALGTGDRVLARVIRVDRKQSARTADPLIFGASIPGNEPVPVRDEYVPLTDDEIREFYHQPNVTTRSLLLAAHRAGWKRRRTP